MTFECSVQAHRLCNGKGVGDGEQTTGYDCECTCHESKLDRQSPVAVQNGHEARRVGGVDP